MDILRDLNDEELKFIIEKLEKHLPYTIKDIYYISSAQKFRNAVNKYEDGYFSDKVLPKFFTHRYGKKENCTIFGITGERNHTVWYFSFDDTLKEITECLEQTKLIRWGTQFLFVTLHTEQIKPVLEFAAKNGYSVESNEYNSYFYLPSEIALNLKIEISLETELVTLNENDAKICNALWKYRNTYSENWMKSLILMHGGYALKDKVSNEILSYGLINDHLAIGALTTIEKAQRKGFAEILVKVLAKKIAENGLTPTVYISKDNKRPFNLFTKLGFIKIAESNWISIAESVK